MIRFDRDGYRFNYRVVAVAIHDEKVLLHRAENDSFWTLPGGRAELGESAEDTIRRGALYFLARFPAESRPLRQLPAGLRNLPASVTHVVQRE